MPARVSSDFGGFVGRVRQIGGRIRRAVNDQLEREAKIIQDYARRMVPEEFGNMERAIKIASSDYRRSWVIYVDETVPDDTGHYTVGAYLTFLHEGEYALGPISRAKQGQGVRVGPKFLERAFNRAVREGMRRRIVEAARRAGVL
jgi:hypothetical protein